jgi:hypothetical protein
MSKYIPWEELKIGDQYGPLELPYIERYFTCEMDELGQIHTKESPWGGPVYPAMYMGTLLGLRMIGSKYDSHATVPARLFQKHQKQQITIRASISEKIESKEGTRMILVFCLQQADGLVNVKGKASGISKA